AGSVTLIRQLNDYYYRGVERIEFADGTIWRQEDLREMVLAQAVTDGDDTIIGFNADDVIRGGQGDDTLTGGKGDDTYIHARGDGHDTITEHAVGGRDDRLVLEGILAHEIIVTREGDDAILNIAASADGDGSDASSVRLVAQFDNEHQRGVESIVFADGTIWYTGQLRANYLENATTDGDDEIFGFDDRDDTIIGGAGEDILRGGSGNDTLHGGDGNDRLEAGTGNNELFGGDGNDRLVSNRGTNSFDGGAGNDTVDYSYSSASWEFNLGAEYARTGSVTEMLVSIENVIGGSGNEIFYGNAADNIFSGGRGSDSYHFALVDGDDVIRENGRSNETDRLTLVELTPDAVELYQPFESEDLVVRILASGETMTIERHFEGTSRGIELIDFADGTSWNRADIEAQITMAGTAGADALVGTGGADLLDGGPGDDVLRGGLGSDSYIYASGYGNDTIIETVGLNDTDIIRLVDLTRADVALSRGGLDLHVEILATGETLTVQGHFRSTQYGIEEIHFSDGEIMDRPMILEDVNTLIGTSGDDTITGTSMRDWSRGGPGDDILDGRGGNDTYLYARGDGHDTIAEGIHNGTDDHLIFEDINPDAITIMRDGTDVTLDLAESASGAGDAGSVHLSRQFNIYLGRGVETIIFADGTSWSQQDVRNTMALEGGGFATHMGFAGDDVIFGRAGSDDYIIGGAGDDTLHAVGGDNVIDGGTGDDVLHAGTGVDSFVFRAGGGVNDVIGFDTIQDRVALDGVDLADISFYQYWNGAQIFLGDGTDFFFRDLTGASLGDFTFIDMDGNALVLPAPEPTNGLITGSDGDDSLVGSSTQGNHIIGGAGDDFLYGVGGDNLLDGGAGSDFMRSGTSQDTFVFRLGDGQDVLENFDITQDRITLDGLEIADLSLNVYSGGSQLIAADGTEFWLIGVTGIVRGDFSFIDMAGNALIPELVPEPEAEPGLISGSEGDEDLVGSSAQDNRITGDAGNDFLDGVGGDNFLDGGAGNDFMASGTDRDTFVFRLGDGQDVIQDFDITQDRIALDGLAINELSLNGSSGGMQLVASDGTEFWLIGLADLTPGDLGFVDMDGNALVYEPLPEPEPGPEPETGPEGEPEPALGAITGTQDDDVLIGSSGQDNDIIGGEGNDFLDGVDGNNTLDGGTGNDYLASGTGQDTFVFRLGDGQNVVDGFDITQDRIALDGLSKIAIEVIGHTGGTQLLAADGTEFWLIDVTGVERSDLSFVDMNGQLIDAVFSDVIIEGTPGNDELFGAIDENNHIIGGAGDDILHAVGGKNILDGGTGDDALHSGTGADTFVFRAGDGINNVSGFDPAQDHIALDGIAHADISFYQYWNGAQIYLADGTDFFFEDLTGVTMDDFSFVDMDGNPIDTSEPLIVLQGTTGDDTLVGSATQNNHISGDAGDDFLDGVDGDNILDGGTGNDFMASGVGEDTFVFRLGDGQNVVENFDPMQDHIALDGLDEEDLTLADHGSGSALVAADGTEFWLIGMTGVNRTDLSFVNYDQIA
ncbi:calcium-binding protein, partial [Saliniramus sp.]|uniref:calcium-binding protein n=1 Tax=Saliniramus sp. TaxID=2986772 RepID=UPI002BDAE50C